MSDPDLELQARIALLNYYKSLMQDYKTYIVTLALSILTVSEIWSRLPPAACTDFLIVHRATVSPQRNCKCDVYLRLAFFLVRAYRHVIDKGYCTPSFFFSRCDA